MPSGTKSVISDATCARPFLRWAGSKRQVLGRLVDFWSPKYARYVEPFAGSSSLFFKIQPAKGLLADKNSALIETYEVLRRSPRRVHNEVMKLPNNSSTYYQIRSKNPRSLSALRRAIRFIYLNRYCFNGIYRTNRQGHFNVPYGKNNASAFPTIDEFEACASLLKRVDLRAWDFGTTLRCVRENDFIYLDPPYAVNSRRVFREYGAQCFGQNDLVRLAEHLTRIDKKGAAFVLSYADCRFAREVLSVWELRRIAVRRNVAGFASARRKAYELVVTNI